MLHGLASGRSAATLLARNEENPDRPLAFIVDPAWRVLPHAKNKPLLELKEEDVVLLFPERLSWKFLQAELRSNRKDTSLFRSQNLCEFVPNEEDLLRVTFEDDDLRAHTKPLSFFDLTKTQQTVMAVDTAYSTSRFADMSCICVGRIAKHDSKDIFIVTDVDMDRWKQSELAVHIVEAIHRNNPDHVLIERNGAWELLQQEIHKAALVRGISLRHIYWKATSIGGTNLKTKAARIKALEPLLLNSQLWFVTSELWNEMAFAQMLKFDGVTKSNSHRHDDFPDCLAMAIEAYFPRIGQSPEESAENKKQRELELQARLRRENYDRIFGGATVRRPPDLESENPSGRGLFGIPGLRARS